MAYSRVVVAGNGVTNQFTVNFALDYLLEADVTCRVGTEVDGGGSPIYRAITFLSTNLVQVAGSVPGNGVQITFERTVDKDELRVDFNNGDQLDEDNLMIAQKQTMMAVHEVLDGRFSVLTKDLDMGGNKVINHGTPTNPTDVATKAYVDTHTSVEANAEAAAYAAAAAQSADDAVDQVALILGQAALTDADRIAAQAAKTAAETARDVAIAATAGKARIVQLDIRDFGAVPRTSAADFTTNATAAIQAAMDTAIGPTVYSSFPVEVLIPSTQFGWGITQLIFRGENLHLVGVGGILGNDIGLHYIGTGAAEQAMIYADCDVHRGGENYRGCALRNLRLNGEDKALHCIKFNGWTRYCNVEHVVCTKAVNPIKCLNGYYSRWTDVEILSNTVALPSGMNPAVFAANAYGANFDICHIMRLESFKMTDIGANLATITTAVLRIAASEAVLVTNMTMEVGREAAAKYVTSGVQIGSGSTVVFDSSYVENKDFHDQMFDLTADNIMVTFQGVNYWNDFKTPVGIRAQELTPITINGTIFGESLNIVDNFFKPATGTRMKGVTLQGNVTLFSGEATGGTHYAANLVSSIFGVTSFPITSLLADSASTGTATVVTGYVPSIASNYISVTPGRAVINGWPVSNMRHSGLRQRLYPELAYVGAWNVKINSLGCPYIEKQAGLFPGSALYKTIATFSTTGGTNNPTSLVLV